MSSAEQLVGRVLDERYRLTALLREGRSGSTYQAARVSDGSPLVVKVLRIANATDREMAVLREDAAVGAKLPHPGIVVPKAVLRTEGGVPYVVYEPIGADEEDLATRLKRRPRLPVVEVAGIVGQAAGALHAAHSVGVVHGDLRPGALLLEGEGGSVRARITDFGFARLRDSRRVAASQSSTGMGVIGAASYMAPEQAEGKPFEPATDQFSLAAIAYEMLCGQGPFGSGSTVAILSRVLHAEPPAMVGVSKSVEEVVLRALAKRPQDRFPSASAFAVALGTAARQVARVRGHSGSTPTVPLQPVLTPPERYLPTEPDLRVAARRWPRWLIALPFGVALLGGGVALLRHLAAASPAPPPAAPPSPSVPPHVLLRLDIVPREALVRIEGRPVSPPEVWLPRGSGALHVVAEAPGYLPAGREVIPDRDQRLVIALTSESAPGPTPSSKAPKAPAGAAAMDRGMPPLNDLRDPFRR